MLGDTIEAFVRIGRIGTSSLTQQFELCHAETGELYTRIEMAIVNVPLPTGKSLPIAPEVRAFLEALPGGFGCEPNKWTAVSAKDSGKRNVGLKARV